MKLRLAPGKLVNNITHQAISFTRFEPEFRMTGLQMHAVICTYVWGLSPLQRNRGQFVVRLQEKSATP
jgi:hypothetical protein